MLKALSFLVCIFFVAAGVVWFFERPGSVILDWEGYRVETTVSVLVGVACAFSIATALLYRGWIILIRAPARVSEAWRERCRTKGYKALTRGMVAVAAGDAIEAGRQVKRAEALMREVPLSLLLSAQSAQLNGNDNAAVHFFEEMAANPEMEFLGLRGLLTHAINSGDEMRALDVAKRAHKLQSKSDWVSKSLFDLQVRAEQWADALTTSDEQLHLGYISTDEHKKRKAVLAVQLGMELCADGCEEEAGRKFKIAYDTEPEFIPAVIYHVEDLIAQAKYGRAVDVLSKGWKNHPHPELVSLFWRATKAEDPINRVKVIDKLILDNKYHLESQILLVQTNLEACLWGEARKFLGAIAGNREGRDEARVCRLWADLEESEHGNVDAVQTWLKRAAVASADPTWICDNCGNSIDQWSAVCKNCTSFGTFRWGRAPHVLAEDKSCPEELFKSRGVRQLSRKN